MINLQMHFHECVQSHAVILRQLVSVSPVTNFVQLFVY